jgi:YegS/Rv2252/BmrU family lipid kinase
MSVSALLVYNPVAGRSALAKKRLELLSGKLRDFGVVPELHLAHPDCRCEMRLKLRDKSLLIICGGDGTIHNILPDALEARVPVGILPTGTANVLARELGVPTHLDQAIEVLSRGRMRSLSLGKADGRYFHLMAGVGADSYIINRVGLSLKRFLGVAAFWVTGLSRFWTYPLREFCVDIDGMSHTATFTVVSNSRYYGGHLLLTPRASVFENKLDVCLFTSKNHFRFLNYLWGSLRGNHLGYPDVIYEKANQIAISGDETIAVQLDGELAGHLPMKFAVADEYLDVIVP